MFALMRALFLAVLLGSASAALAQPAGAPARVGTFNFKEYSKLTSSGEHGKALDFALTQLKAAEAAGDEAMIAEAANHAGSSYRRLGRLDEAAASTRRALEIRQRIFGTDHTLTSQSLNDLALVYRGQRRFADAEDLLKRAIAITEKAKGPETASLATNLNNLANLYRDQGRNADAEPLLKRVVGIREKIGSPDNPDLATNLSTLASVYQDLGRYADAEPLLKRMVAIREKSSGPDHPDLATNVTTLAWNYQNQGRYAEAEPLIKRALAIREKSLGPEHPSTSYSLRDLASLFQDRGLYAEAEPLLKRALAIQEKARGPDHPDIAVSLFYLASAYRSQGRFGDAESLSKRALAIRETALGPEHPLVAAALNDLALVYNGQGRSADAEPLLKRAIAIRERSSGPATADLATNLFNLGATYRAQGRYAEAESLLKRSLAIREAVLGPEHPRTSISLNDLALVYRDQGRNADAEPLLKRAAAIREKASGPDHPELATTLANLAVVYQRQERYADAEPLYRRALAIREKRLGPSALAMAYSYGNLGSLAFERRNWPDAVAAFRRASAIVAQRAADNVAGDREGLSSETQRNSAYFRGLVQSLYRVAEAQPSTLAANAAEAFESAQWAMASDTSAVVAQMAVRSAAENPSLAAVIRERQDLLREAQQLDGVLVRLAGAGTADRATAENATANDRLRAVNGRLGAIDDGLRRDFPDFAELQKPSPSSLTKVQASLRPEEALVLFLDVGARKPDPEATFVWVVTRSDVRWIRSALGPKAIRETVRALRCGLDPFAWDDDAQPACADLVGPGHGRLPLPFDLARAFRLYDALLRPAADLIEGKRLVVVPSGALTQLPFHVLLTAAPTGEDFRSQPWLARSHGVTVLPSVSSLPVLRRVARPSGASRAFLGIGNPLLDGDGRTNAADARQARARQSCTQGRPTTVASARGGVLPVRSVAGVVDPAFLRRQPPLPETVDELCAAAAAVHAGTEDLLLGAKATEQTVKAKSASGQLTWFRTLHFATHAAMAGELVDGGEPGLILTPPAKISAQDDGYLSASEVAALKLDADLVILSACNTAAGGAGSAEALSGLARAFLYAGARTLVVSHWSVDSRSTVRLMIDLTASNGREGAPGLSESLRRAMLSMIEEGGDTAHPFYWAPFFVVGEGARRQTAGP